ncbi:dihydropyrimidinase [Desulfopila sp. IMCC35006]|uniref:dihydropyrimidinase n=1 Tax=Desulfopila sp. IMCC35006 TaxID=2569542 RepID=UPI0010AC2C76|nr:dihydropyrimidinase [Desulfopila sp. IMCC35006]TKB23877.1 dihydropyrimidinase [Desulfopila sp. IMCC35006]
MQDILIKNGIIVTADKTLQADLLLVDGTIAALGEALERQGAQVIDAAGQYVMPGGVDAHTHLNLTVGSFKVSDGFYEGSAAAAFGGTTCVVEHPSFGPDGCSLLHQIKSSRLQAEKACVVDFGLHGVFQHVTPSILDEMQMLSTHGVSSAKIYLTYSGRLQDRQILDVLNRAKGIGLLTAFHAEHHDIIDFLSSRFQAEQKGTARYHPLSRPDYAEAEAIYRIISLAEAVGDVPVYIVHLSTAAGLRIIEKAQDRGLPVYAEVCPQHLLLDDACYEDPERGLRYIMAPPARKAADTAALWQGLAQGSIAVAATDHCSFTFGDKLSHGRDDFTKAPGGIPGVETRLPLLFSEGVLKNRLSLHRFVDVVSTAPARLMGLFPRKGHLAPGADGDVILFDPKMEKIITPKILRQNADYSPYEGMLVRGWPTTTIVRGRIVVREGKLLADQGWGQYIDRGPAVSTSINEGERHEKR